MDNEQNGVQDNLNPEEVMDNESEETVESLKAKIQELQSAKEKADEIARNQKIRAEKAELEKKSNGKWSRKEIPNWQQIWPELH